MPPPVAERMKRSVLPSLALHYFEMEMNEVSPSEDEERRHLYAPENRTHTGLLRIYQSSWAVPGQFKHHLQSGCTAASSKLARVLLRFSFSKPEVFSPPPPSRSTVPAVRRGAVHIALVPIDRPWIKLNYYRTDPYAWRPRSSVGRTGMTVAMESVGPCNRASSGTCFVDPRVCNQSCREQCSLLTASLHSQRMDSVLDLSRDTGRQGKRNRRKGY
jgi:hypothetical protein